MTVVVRRTHRRKLGKCWEGLRASGTGVQSRAQPKTALVWEWKGIGLGLESDSV